MHRSLSLLARTTRQTLATATRRSSPPSAATRRIRSISTMMRHKGVAAAAGLGGGLALSVQPSSRFALTRTFCAAAAAAPTTASKGKRVQVEYVGKFEDGTIFDASEGRGPLEFTVGQGEMIPGFDTGVDGMSIGETKELTLSPAEAYGEWDERGLQEVGKDKLPENIEVGMELQTGTGGRAVIKEINETTAKVDLNHPLAGKTLQFTLTLVAVADAPTLQVEILSPGDGKTFPSKGDKLTMHYTGTLAKDGSKVRSRCFFIFVFWRPIKYFITVPGVLSILPQKILTCSHGLFFSSF